MKVWTRKTIQALAIAVLMLGGGSAARATEEDMMDQQEELRSTLGALTQQLNDLKKWSDELPKPEVNVDLRYDGQRYKSATINPTAVGPKAGAFVDGGYGMYAKRTEFKLKAIVPNMTWMTWELQYDFSGMKLEDVGVTMTGLSFWPMSDTPGWTWDLKVGQYRQPFGIEPQTSSSATYFSERSILNGGANPFGAPQLVKERVMGIHVKHKKDLGFIGYNMAASVANDFDNSTKGGTGTDSLAGAFPNQPKDQDPSEFGRLGLESLPLNAMLPFGSKIAVGASALHNSENTVLMASTAATQKWSDVYGLDAAVDMFQMGGATGGPALKIQVEWAAKNQFDPAAPFQGLKNRAEDWYALVDVEPWKFFDANAPKVEFLARYENAVPSVGSTAAYTSGQAISAGLRYQFMGKNYSSINYYTFGLAGDFSALPGTELLVVQQQFNY